jgi:hypothetical protein
MNDEINNLVLQSSSSGLKCLWSGMKGSFLVNSSRFESINGPAAMIIPGTLQTPFMVVLVNHTVFRDTKSVSTRGGGLIVNGVLSLILDHVIFMNGQSLLGAALTITDVTSTIVMGHSQFINNSGIYDMH